MTESTQIEIVSFLVFYFVVNFFLPEICSSPPYLVLI